jgi:hypothetical protein
MNIADVRAQIRAFDTLINHHIIAHSKSTSDPYVAELIKNRDALKFQYPKWDVNRKFK